MLHVRMPGAVQPGEPVGINLTYVIQIPHVAPTAWLPEGNLGAGEFVIQAGDWHPTLVPYAENGGWQTWEYYPVGDPTVYDVADYDVRIFADPKLVIAAPGEISHAGPARHYVYIMREVLHSLPARIIKSSKLLWTVYRFSLIIYLRMLKALRL